MDWSRKCETGNVPSLLQNKSSIQILCMNYLIQIKMLREKVTQAIIEPNRAPRRGGEPKGLSCSHVACRAFFALRGPVSFISVPLDYGIFLLKIDSFYYDRRGRLFTYKDVLIGLEFSSMSMEYRERRQKDSFVSIGQIEAIHRQCCK